MELTYSKRGEYCIPDLALPDMANYEIGKYGRMRKRFLREHHRGMYEDMLLSGKLWPHLAEADNACTERMEIIISKMAKVEGVTETLKASDQMEWVRRINSIHDRAEEIILHELIFI